MTNPLLSDWTTPFALPPFDLISDDDYSPAVDAALERARATMTAIADVAGADSNPKREELQREFGPKLSAFGSEVTENKALFARVEALWQDRDSLELTAEQQRVLMLSRRGFVRQGAQLEGDAAKRLRDVKARLSVLGTTFTQNLLTDERSWFMALGADDLGGLPDFVIATARAAGAEKDAGGPVVTLSRSLIVPFLQFSSRRDLRQAGNRNGGHAQGRPRSVDAGLGTRQGSRGNGCRETGSDAPC